MPSRRRSKAYQEAVERRERAKSARIVEEQRSRGLAKLKRMGLVLMPDGKVGRIPTKVHSDPSVRFPLPIRSTLPRRRAPSGVFADLVLSKLAQQVRRVVPAPIVRAVRWLGRDSRPYRNVRLFRPVFSSGRTVCDIRSERRQVMFAKRVAGRRWGGRGPSPPRRRTLNSQVSCRR